MATKGYVLIETDVGKANSVAAEINAINSPTGRVIAVDAVTGPYDVIVKLEGDDLDCLGNIITQVVQRVNGVQRTTTCLAVRLD